MLRSTSTRATNVRFRRAVERGVQMSRGRHEVAASEVRSGDGVFDAGE